MAIVTHTITLSGDARFLDEDSPAVSVGVYGSATLYRVRAKKSGTGDFSFNIDASASKSSKYPPFPSVVMDFDADSLVGELSDGDDIPTLSDYSVVRDATQTSGNQPEWQSAGSNITSKSSIKFGSSKNLNIGGTTPSFAHGSPFSIALVVDDFDNNDYPIIGSDVGSSSYASWYGNDGSRQVKVQSEGGDQLISTKNDYIQGSDIRVLTRDSSNTGTEYSRGVSTVTGALRSVFSIDALGSATQSSSTTYASSLELSRVIVSDICWSAEQREDVEAWLAWEYGLQTSSNSYLPSTHVGYQSDPRQPLTKSYNSDIDISSLSVDTWSSYYAPDTSTIGGTIDIIPMKVYKAGTITIEILVSV